MMMAPTLVLFKLTKKGVNCDVIEYNFKQYVTSCMDVINNKQASILRQSKYDPI